MKFFLIFLLSAGIAAASGGKVYASEDIAFQSELLGSFGEEDTSVFDNFNNLLEDLSGTGMDLVDDNGELLEEDLESAEGIFVSGNVPFTVYPDDYVMPLANYDTYYGSISSTYLEYMRGYLPKLHSDQHYVASRIGQYTYIFAYGDTLSFDGSRFFGSNIQVITWNTSGNGTFYYNVEGSFSLNPGSYLVYSDLSDIYPTLADLSGFTSRQLLIFLSIVFLVWTMDHMYNVRKIRRIKKGKF